MYRSPRPHPSTGSVLCAHLKRITALVVVALMVACGSDSPSDPDPGGNPSISITLGTATLVLQQGENSTVRVTLTRSGGFSGGVTVSLEGLPTGVTAPSAQIASGQTTADLAVTVAAGAAVGAVQATVRAVGTGVAAATATLNLEVTAAPVGGFALALAPSALTVQQGASGQSTLTITRTSPFTGAVQIASNAPSGITIGGIAAAIAGGSAALTVQVDGSVTPGTFSITLTGSASGVSDATTTLDLTVTAAPSGSDFTWGFCEDIPVWVAIQDGSSAWQQIVGNGALFDFSVTSDQVKVAAVFQDGAEYETVVFHLSRDEAVLRAGTCPVYKTINGTVVGLAAGQISNITLSRAATTLVGGTGTTFSLDRVEDGVTDFFASLWSAAGGLPSLDKMFLQRDINPPGGSSVTVDFTGPDAFDPASIMVTATGLGTDMAGVSTSFLTPTIGASVFAPGPGAAGPTWTVPVLPQGMTRAGDIQAVSVAAIDASNPLAASRGTVKYFETVADQTLTMGPYLGSVAVTSEQSAPFARPRVVYTRQPEYLGHINVSFGQDMRDVIFWVTDDYLGAAADLDVAFPDFSGVAGWLDTYGLMGGVATTWVVNANGWTSGPGTIGPDTYTDGLEVRSGIQTGTITP